MPFEVQPQTGKRAAVIGSGPAGMAAAYYLLIAGHDVTVFERDPAPGGMLRYGIPQYRLPKVEVLEAEYQSVTRPRRQDRLRRRAWAATSRSTTSRTRASTRSCVAIGCYDTNKLGVPGRGRRRSPRRPRVPAHRDARPALPGPRRQARRGHRRRLHLDGLLAHLGPPGRGRGDARLPPRHEGHARRERGPRGDRGGRAGDLPGRRRRASSPTTSGKVTGVEFQRMAPRRARRVRPAPAGARRRAPSSSIECDRVLLAIGQGPELDWIGPRLGRRRARPSNAASRPTR